MMPEPQTQPPSPKHDPDLPSSSSSSAASYFSPPDHVYPPGFRFTPTDEELVLYYLKPFSRGIISSWPIHHVNIYESNPQRLSAEYEKGNLKEWFFISERTNVNKGGKRQKRGDNGGYWHATGAAKKFSAGQGVVGNKATLVYYAGKQSNGVKTNWLMKEYWLESSSDNNKTVGHVLCKIYQSPMAKNKKKAVEKEVEQPRNVEYQQPQAQFWPTPLDSHQLQPHDIAYHQPHQPQPLDTVGYQQPQFWPAPLDSHQSQPHDIGCHQPQPLDTVGYQQPQFWPAPLDSHQSQPHDIGCHQPQPLDTVGYQQPHQPHVWPAPLDSHQSQPHDIAYHQPHQPQPLDTIEYQQPQICPAPLDSHQLQPRKIVYQPSDDFIFLTSPRRF